MSGRNTLSCKESQAPVLLSTFHRSSTMNCCYALIIVSCSSSCDLQSITPSFKQVIQGIKDKYIENEGLVEEEESSRLRLPSREFIMYDDGDIEFLSQINNEDHLTTLVQDYILGTISEVIRLVEGVALDDPAIPRLKFNLSSALCPAHHARWDLFALVSLTRRCVKLPQLIVNVARKWVQPYDLSFRHFRIPMGIWYRGFSRLHTAAERKFLFRLSSTFLSSTPLSPVFKWHA
jgi:hypothetical protein